MSICLTPWLEETFTEQLLLGHHWLQQRTEQKEAGIKLEKDAVWRGLYHDSHSCLEIITDLDPNDKHFLHIIQLSPPILCDSNHHILTHFTPQCLTQLRSVWPTWDLTLARLRTSIAVRKYSVRYTPYGPPRERLQLILHTADWLPQSAAGIQGFNPKVLKSLWSDGIAAVTRKLEKLRNRNDRRCLGSQVIPDIHDTVMTDLDDPVGGESQPHTQLPFGTQLPQSIRLPVARSRITSDDGNQTVRATQKSIVRNSAGSEQQKKAQLLSLLHKGGPTIPAASETPRGESSGASEKRSQDTVAPSTEQLLTQLPVSIEQGHLQPRAKTIESAVELPESYSIEVEQHTMSRRKPSRASVHEPEPVKKLEPQQSRLQELASQCSWLKDFEFNREAFRVNNRQLSLLQRDESWHKPPPGKNFPDGNIPIEILNMIHRLADESAASGAAPDSDDAMDEDPSPESVIETADPTPQSPVEVAQPEPSPSSPVSWSSSPEPPQMPARIFNELPPDSSLEPHNATTTITESHMQPSATPRAVPPAIEPHEEADISSSPPDVFTNVSDDEMEMEMEDYIPQGLGEDIPAPANIPSTLPTTFRSPALKSVVQVKETPVAKNRSARIYTQLATSSQNKNSTGLNKPHSSTSIIYATYDDAKPREAASVYSEMTIASPKRGEGQLPAPNVVTDSTTQSLLETDLAMEDLSPHFSSSQHSPEHSNPDTSPGQQVTSDQTRSPQEVSVQTHPKRKHENSPSKKSSRHVKRRIKIVGFGSEKPSSVDPTAALRRDREEALQRFREQRRSSAAPEESLRAKPDVKAPGAEEADVAKAPELRSHSAIAPSMSPRHMSLYDDPDSVTLDSSATVTMRDPQLANVVEVVEVDRQTDMVEQKQISRPPELTTPPTVFVSFKNTYPEYSGDAKHFATQCSKIYALDIKDRMVPKWQWDDYIIRNRTMDWKNFALECLDRGEEPPEYIRYYKDHIRDTLYSKSVVTDKQTLLRALKELGVALPEARQNPSKQRESEPETPQTARKKSRMSLPSAFDTTNRTASHAMDTERKRPRVSFPAGAHTDERQSNKSSQTNHQSPLQKVLARQSSTTPSTSTAKPAAHLNRNAFPSPATARRTNGEEKPTSDPFEDFIYAQKRMTSLTGSKEFDPKRPWPQNLAVRPSIDDMPKRKTDVLKWKDEL